MNCGSTVKAESKPQELSIDDLSANVVVVTLCSLEGKFIDNLMHETGTREHARGVCVNCHHTQLKHGQTGTMLCLVRASIDMGSNRDYQPLTRLSLGSRVSTDLLSATGSSTLPSHLSESEAKHAATVLRFFRKAPITTNPCGYETRVHAPAAITF